MKRIKLLFVVWCTIALRVAGAEGPYLGGQLGFVGLSGNLKPTFSNHLGFSGDLGVRTSSLMDLVFRFHYSSHDGGGGLQLMSPSLSADLHVGRWMDFDFTLGAGPGFYFFKTAQTESKFGVHAGAAVDVLVDERLGVGLGTRWNGIFGATSTSDSFWTVMMRVGYWFGEV